jgi:hypothetical protein
VTRGAQVSVLDGEKIIFGFQFKISVDLCAKKLSREGKFSLLFGLNYLQSLNEKTFPRSQ